MPHASYHAHPVRSYGHGHGHVHARHLIQERAEEAYSPKSASYGTESNHIVRRDSGSDDTMINLLLIILGLVFLALLSVAALWFLRRRRQRLARAAALASAGSMNDDGLPSYSEKAACGPGGLTIETKHNGRSSTIYINRDGQPMLANPKSPPHSPDNVPEIHITFPDEQDDQGKNTSGRVLVVRVGDNASVGLEPVSGDDEQLPAYEKDSKAGFYSVDMDKIGGLKEKDPRYE
ncbi:hypothetical protein GMORB2_2133 [Geosmithia morbida]|uniref:Uncharacterized protein n=1 Tax=Geosmithia morbida TaxID=1094350 RepID=A0A9P5D263_9HYPO|nr:uncharacterized protein GMORB2_2133 [Geosmithia morbida]KAF4121171.1 hypothetical protein GMORB2_2133 [Geosmithia morbida]